MLSISPVRGVMRHLVSTCSWRINMSIIRRDVVIPVIAVVLYLASMLFPAFYTEFVHNYGEATIVEGGDPYYGWRVLLLGWVGILDWTIAWYANPAFVAALVLHALGSRASVKLAVIALALGLSSLLYRNMWGEDGTPEHIYSYGPAFYLWLASFALMLYAAVERFR